MSSPRRLAAVLGGLLTLALLLPVAHAAGEFPDRYYFYNGKNAAVKRLRDLEGKPAPPLALKDWIGEPQTLEGLKGDIVVIDFWATWCGPCMRALPKNVQLAEKYRDENVTFIGIHDSARGHARMPDVVKSMKLNYPVAVDQARQSERAWRVGFWPTYAVIDRQGVVRAAGITPNNIEPVIKQILVNGTYEAAAEPEAVNGIPANWLEGTAAKRKRLERLADAETPPALSTATNWRNSEALELEDLKGKVVLLDFWATWCQPCMRAVPKMNKLMAEHGDDGLVIIGVCHPKGGERMDEVVAERGIRYPVCLDVDRQLISAYAANGFPDYYVIDRAGTLRIADLSNMMVEQAVELLLAEDAE